MYFLFIVFNIKIKIINIIIYRKENYSKVKFFELLRTNIFFKRYYMERYNGEYNFIKGWYIQDIIINM